MGPKTIVSLDDVASDPNRVMDIPLSIATALLARCAIAQGVLVARLLALHGQAQESARHSVETDRLLSPAEAAGLLGVTPRWLYRRAQGLPFTRRLSRKVLRFSERGLRSWQARR